MIYSSLDNMLSAVPYGGISVFYPDYENDLPSRYHYSMGQGGNIIPNSGMEYEGPPLQWQVGEKWYNKQIDPSNYAFVITFSCNYPFSNSLVKWLFNGGSNTVKQKGGSGYNDKADDRKGTMYLLWARGAGIVNKK